MPETTLKRVRFGEFAADLASQELFRAGQPVRLANQSFVALATLLERPGQLVTREELRARLWPDNRVVEFEQGLNAIINRLREALGDEAENPRFIETLPRRGYRFIGALESPANDFAAVPAARETSLDPGAPELLGPPRRGIHWLVWFALTSLLAAGMLAYWQLGKSTSETPLAVIAPLTSLVGEERMPALSPEGERLAFAWNGEPAAEGAGFDLYLKPVASERHTRLTHSPATAIGAAWSPDGTRIAFARIGARDGGLFAVPGTGGAERKLAAASFAQESLIQPAWSPDGGTLAYSAIDGTGSQALRLLTLATLESRALPNAPSCWHAGAPAWVDSRRLAFVCMTSVAVYGVFLATPDSTAAPVRLASLQGFPRGLAWAPDRARLQIANDGGDGGGIWELELDGTLHRPTVVEDSLASGVSAADGLTAYSRARQQIDIWHVSIESRGSQSRRWIYSTRTQLTPQYSPDGARIAFQSDRSGNPEIWLADADGGNPVRLTSIGGPLTGAPAWCSDGRRLAFDSRQSGASAIYVVDVLERVPRRVETPQSNLALPVWSGDCRWLLASDGRERLYRIPAQGGEAQRFTMQRSYQAAVMGERVVFNVAETTGIVLWTKPLDGGEERRLPGMPRLSYEDSWAVGDSAIYFTDVSRRPAVVRRYEFTSGASTDVAVLANTPTPLGGLGLTVARDGRTLLYTHTADSQSDLVLATLPPPR